MSLAQQVLPKLVNLGNRRSIEQPREIDRILKVDELNWLFPLGAEDVFAASFQSISPTNSSSSTVVYRMKNARSTLTDTMKGEGFVAKRGCRPSSKSLNKEATPITTP